MANRLSVSRQVSILNVLESLTADKSIKPRAYAKKIIVDARSIGSSQHFVFAKTRLTNETLI